MGVHEKQTTHDTDVGGTQEELWPDLRGFRVAFTYLTKYVLILGFPKDMTKLSLWDSILIT